MHCRRRDLDPSIYLLVEHLDAVLAVGDELTSLSMLVTEPTSRTGPRMMRSREARFAAFVNRARNLEASLIAHILQARRRTSELPRVRGALKMPMDLFTSGTTVLLDAIAEYGDPAALAFNSGADRLAYLRAREVIASDTAVLLPSATLEISESFLVAGRLQLGPLLDLVETFMRALNVQYELWDDSAEDEIDDAPRLSRLPERPMPRLEGIQALEVDLAKQIAIARTSLAAVSSGAEKSVSEISAGPPPLPQAKPPALPGARPGSLIAALKDIEQLRPRSD
jgi:hypothetical protein